MVTCTRDVIRHKVQLLVKQRFTEQDSAAPHPGELNLDVNYSLTCIYQFIIVSCKYRLHHVVCNIPCNSHWIRLCGTEEVSCHHRCWSSRISSIIDA